MENEIINIGGKSRVYSVENSNELICGMENNETYFFNTVFDNSINLVDRNEFVYEKFESFFAEGNISEINKIINNSALKDAHGSIVKTMIILSAGHELLAERVTELNEFLIKKFGH